jgi:hypothetical protein
MAVVVELTVDRGTREQHDALDVKVTEAMQGRGGPPAGMMFHLTWPAGDGFVILDVWRTDAEARQFTESVVIPAMADVGLEAGEPNLRSVWGMASPQA